MLSVSDSPSQQYCESREQDSQSQVWGNLPFLLLFALQNLVIVCLSFCFLASRQTNNGQKHSENFENCRKNSQKDKLKVWLFSLKKISYLGLPMFKIFIWKTKTKTLEQLEVKGVRRSYLTPSAAASASLAEGFGEGVQQDWQSKAFSFNLTFQTVSSLWLGISSKRSWSSHLCVLISMSQCKTCLSRHSHICLCNFQQWTRHILTL